MPTESLYDQKKSHTVLTSMTDCVNIRLLVKEIGSGERQVSDMRVERVEANVSKLVNAAVIGAGHWGERHAHAYFSLPQAKLVGICDVDRSKAEALANRHDADKIYNSVEELLDDPEVQIVSIAVPDHLHTEAAVACASSGRHILVEKPLALTIEGCESIIQAARAGRAHLMVDFANRWNAPLMRAKELITEGQISSPRLAHIRLNNAIYVPTEMLGWSSHSNVLWWIGSHAIDLARWLFDDEVEAVSSVAGWGRLRSMGIDTADYYVTTLQFREGGVAVIENCWILPNERSGLVDFNVQIVSDTGTLTMDTLGHRAIEYVGAAGVQRPDLFYDYELAGSTRGAFIDAVSHFVESVLWNSSPSVSGRDGLEVTRIILAALESAEKGAPVRLEKQMAADTQGPGFS